jgi:hypothetical protein
MVALPSRRPFATHRELVWVEKAGFTGWACAECAWWFNPSEIPAGNTIAEIKEKYERARDKNFESHVCAAHPKRKD